MTKDYIIRALFVCYLKKLGVCVTAGNFLKCAHVETKA